ncbi:hypothetical protein [Oceanisphaera sp. KMM 10153]|uniref:hypothetical protein n=1 Tax=Oceanisphaera submarina TaxID=3390193 RepID=UPI003975F5E6
MSDFATKKQKPSAKEYLEASLDQVVERLNNNPNGHKSEEALIQAVITVRAAKINERLSHRLNWLTGMLVLATICLVAVPFIAPSIEKKQIEAQISSQATLIESQNAKLEQLAQTISKLAQEQGTLAAEVEKHNKALQPTAQPLARPGGG